MTGTGTQADPYIVDNETDFRNAVSQFGKYVKCVPDMVIDLSDCGPYAEPFNFYCKGLDGNGLIIQNGRFEDYVLKTDVDSVFNNINVLDCASTRSADEASIIYCPTSYKSIFDHCTFRTQSEAGSLCYK